MSEQDVLFPDLVDDDGHQVPAAGRRHVRGELVDVAEGVALPAFLVHAGEDVVRRSVEFFLAEIRNPNTRQSYARALSGFCAWARADGRDLELDDVQPLHVAAWVEELSEDLAPSSVKQSLAAVRRFWRYLLTDGVVRHDPTAPVRGPKIRRGEGKTPVLAEGDARALLAAIDTRPVIGLRDRALISMMLTSLARVGAVVRMRVGDFQRFPAGATYALLEKGGQHRRLEAHPESERYLVAYLQAGGLEHQADAPLWQSVDQRGDLTGRAMASNDIRRMIKRRAEVVGIAPEQVTSHTLRVTGATDYMDKGGDLLTLQELAGHASPETTRGYVRTSSTVRRSEILRIQAGIAETPRGSSGT